MGHLKTKGNSSSIDSIITIIIIIIIFLCPQVSQVYKSRGLKTIALL